ncbi:rha [Oratosquilla oratoria]|uniref:rha n=1 Tax=Oratosquilla oratoria TaxID=337810 RepID=UPI003F75C4BF
MRTEVPLWSNLQDEEQSQRNRGLKTTKVSTNNIAKNVKRQEKSPINELSVVYETPYNKRIEIENLIDQLVTLQNEDRVNLSSTITQELVGEAGRKRGTFRSSLLTPELKVAAKELRERKDIIIRKGDKASVFVILDTNTYLEKMDSLLENPTKFQRLQKDPCESLKKKINTLIQEANRGSKFFNKVIGDFKPGYCYGTVKTHKPGNPLRPIIAQLSTPTYPVAKTLNNLLSPYVPTGRSVSSAAEFIDLLRTAPPCQDIASLDAESLFTHVNVDETISYILDRVYRSDLPALDIQEYVLKAMLETCTKEAPFLSHRGELFKQVDGVAMGSPLGVLFANMYMAQVCEF